MRNVQRLGTKTAWLGLDTKVTWFGLRNNHAEITYSISNVNYKFEMGTKQ